eukprot:12908431-Prorocentrum_lima.AAC.1
MAPVWSCQHRSSPARQWCGPANTQRAKGVNRRNLPPNLSGHLRCSKQSDLRDTCKGQTRV